MYRYIFSHIVHIVGLGFALSYTPSVAMVGNYFNERKALAYGIGLSGNYIYFFCMSSVLSIVLNYPFLPSCFVDL